MLESFVRDKHSSLFGQFISGKEQMLQNFLLPLFTIGPNKLECLSMASVTFASKARSPPKDGVLERFYTREGPGIVNKH